MDAYEATRVVFSRIQAFDPDNAAKIIALLFAQDQGDKEMIRLAFGPETLLHSLVLNARKDLGLQPPSFSTSPPSAPAAAAPFLQRQNSISSPRPPPLSPSWGAFSRSGSFNGAADDHHAPPSPFYSATHDLPDHLSFLADSAPKPGGDPFFQDVADDPYWGSGDHQHRQDDIFLNSDGGLWRPCLYYARGFCKNGSTCRFVHGTPEDGAKMDAAVEQELLLRSRSPRLGNGAPQFAASAFPYSPTGGMPASPSSPSARSMSFLQHLQQNNVQRAAAAAATAMILGGGSDEVHKYLGRSRMERSDFAGIINPGSRQIYLTFPADSSFREEDVSNYFSIYGPVQDVRIPYQQKRMFGFVTFVYAETVKLILAKGNPHFVCDARVLVKPYKEKGKVPDKYRKLQLQQQVESLDFSGCISPTGLERDPYDMPQFGSRMIYNGSRTQEMLLRRKLEEQKQAAELQQAIELQGQRLMGLQLMDLKTRSLPSPIGTRYHPNSFFSPPEHTPEHSSPEDKSPSSDDSSAASAAATALSLSQAADLLLSTSSSSSSSNGLLHQAPAKGAAIAGADKEESAGESSSLEDNSDFRESVEHILLPDSPFASPKKASAGDLFSRNSSTEPELTTDNSNSNLIANVTSSFNMPSFKPAYLQMHRFSAGHGAVGM